MPVFAVGPKPVLVKRGNPSLVLPEVLRELCVGRRTGLFHVIVGQERVSFRFVNGEVVSGSSTSEKGRLGETMVRHGLLAPKDLERALLVVEQDRRRLGPVLLEMGMIEASGLEQALALHMREMLLTALGWDHAAHVFEEQELPDGPTEDLSLRSSTGELILEVVRRIPNLETVRLGLGDLDRVLAVVPDPPFRFDRITPTPADAYVLSRVDGTVSAREIIEITPLPVEDVERSLVGLLCTGVIEYRHRVTPAPRPVAEKRAEDKAREGAPPRPATETAEPAKAAGELRTAVERAYDGLSAKNHFQALGLPPTASAADVKKAYAQLVKTLHPDANPQLDPELRPKLQAVFTRITDAYHVLGSPQRRARYEATLRTEARPAPSAVPQKVEAAAAPSREAGADTRSVPDAVRAAEGHLAKGRYWEAVSLLENVIPQASGGMEHRARLLLARSYLTNLAFSPEWPKRAEAELLKVIRLDPKDVEAHYALAKFYGERSFPARARAMLQKVVELQPAHQAAQAELALLRPQAPDSKFLGKLLRRTRRA